MLSRQEIRTLKGQLLLLAGLFLGSAGLAVALAVSRPLFERHQAETYKPLPAHLAPLAESAAAGGHVDRAAFDKLPADARLALYDDWMLRPEPPPPATPAALVAADPALYLSRAERTLVAGNDSQRERALKFLELSGSPKAVPVLERAGEWARRRNLPDLAGRIEQTVIALRPAD